MTAEVFVTPTSIGANVVQGQDSARVFRWPEPGFGLNSSVVLAIALRFAISLGKHAQIYILVVHTQISKV